MVDFHLFQAVGIELLAFLLPFMEKVGYMVIHAVDIFS
jgi:hypothetical protein